MTKIQILASDLKLEIPQLEANFLAYHQFSPGIDYLKIPPR